ncbi:MAG: PmoA family protein [Phycisphaerales bacterium]|nr:MAG: PmoA family protein [Phycisphaerales bacterium]
MFPKPLHLSILIALGIAWAGGERVRAAAQSRPGDAVELVREGDEIVLRGGPRPAPQVGRRLVLRYRDRAVPFKPYVKELFTPGGVNVVVDSPADHVHHHGLMLAVGADEIDFWGEEPADAVGREITVSTEPLTEEGAVGFRSRIEWQAPDGSAILRERRSVVWRHNEGKEPTYLIWRSEITPAPGQDDVNLWGRHYFGLGMRFVESMSEATTFLHADGVEGRIYRGDERLTPGRWCAAQGTAEGKPVTIAMFDHPLNPRYPATWFIMNVPFAYLSATANLEAQPRLLGRGEIIHLRYGIAVWDGHIAPDEIETAYDRFLASENLLRDHVNVARSEHGTTVHASSEYGADYEGGKAIDGRYLKRETDKWNSAANVTPHYLRLDLGQPRLIDVIVLRHEGALPVLDGHSYNTADFRLQHSGRPWGPWIDLVRPVRNNTDNVTIHVFEPTETRYVRLLIETGEQNGSNTYGRIAEFEVYSPDSKVQTEVIE